MHATITVCYPIFLAGFDTTFSADVTNILPNRTLTVSELSLIGSINLYVSGFVCLSAGYLINRIGRKNLIRVALMLNVFSWSILTFFPHCVGLIYASRVLSGFASGTRLASIVYISEISHKTRRGKLLTFIGVSFSSGMCATYWTQYFFSWKMVAIIALIISVYGSVQIHFLQETKYWLLLNGDVENARISMMEFDDTLSDGDVCQEIDEIRARQQQQRTRGTGVIYFFSQPSNVKSLTFCFLASCLRRGSGRVAMTAHSYQYYSQYQQLPIAVSHAVLTQGTLNLLFSALNTFFVDWLPRKILLHSYCWLLNACLAVALCRVPLVHVLGSTGQWLLLLALTTYFGVACTPLNNVIMITISEIASTSMEARGPIMAVAQFTGVTLSAVYSSLFPFVVASVPLNDMLLFPLANVTLMSLLMRFAPETRGKALHKCGWHDDQPK